MRQIPQNNDDRDIQKALSPKLAGAGAASFYALIAIPVAWVASGLVNLGADRLFSKIPFKHDTWARFKQLDIVTVGVLGGIIGYDAYKEGKKAYNEAKDAEHKFDKLSLEHDLYRQQLVANNIRPYNVHFVGEMEMKAATAPAMRQPSPSSHTAKVEAEKLAVAEAVPTNSK